MKHYQVDVEVWHWLENYDAGRAADGVVTYDVAANTPEEAKSKAEEMAAKRGSDTQPDGRGFVHCPMVRGTVSTDLLTNFEII